MRRVQPMRSDLQSQCWIRRLGPAVMFLGLGLLGCGSMPGPLPDANSPIRLPAFKSSKAETEAFKRRVRNDPFPTAGQVGAGMADAK